MNPDVISLASATGARKSALKAAPLVRSSTGDYYDVSKYALFTIVCDRIDSTSTGVLLRASAITDSGGIREVPIYSRFSSGVLPEAYTKLTATIFAGVGYYQTYFMYCTGNNVLCIVDVPSYVNIVGVKSVDSRGTALSIVPLALRA